jgi:hypothetical protein
MKQLWWSVLSVGVISAAAPVAAQAQGTADPSVYVWNVSVNTGVAVAEKVTGVLGVDVNRRLWRSLDVVFEGEWAGNAANGHQRSGVGDLAGYLTATEGQAATGSVDVPLLYAGGGVRWVFGQVARVRPYGVFTAGVAHTSPNATFTLGGTDITGSIGDYGIALGKDLSGSSNHGAVGFGVGALAGSGQWYMDVGLRLLNFGSETGRVNLGQFVIGGGYRF